MDNVPGQGACGRCSAPCQIAIEASQPQKIDRKGFVLCALTLGSDDDSPGRNIDPDVGEHDAVMAADALEAIQRSETRAIGNDSTVLRQCSVQLAGELFIIHRSAIVTLVPLLETVSVASVWLAIRFDVRDQAVGFGKAVVVA